MARRRIHCRESAAAIPFERRRSMPDALAKTIGSVQADIVVVTFCDDCFVPLHDLAARCQQRGGPAEVLAFDQQRHIGSRIGIESPSAARVGTVSRAHTTG